MKKLSVLVLIFTLLACASVSIQNQVIQEIAARRLAFTLAKANPSIIQPGIVACDAIIGAQDIDTATVAAEFAAEQLSKYVGNDPLLKSDLESIFKTTGINGPKLDLTMLKAAAMAFRQGLELAKG